MARRESQFLSLSFLDILSGALGAIIYLFIITPKGGAPPSERIQANVSFDTLHRQVFGNLADSLQYKKIGDTLFVVLTAFKEMPTIEQCPDCPPMQKCPECPDNKGANQNRIANKEVANSNTVTTLKDGVVAPTQTIDSASSNKHSKPEITSKYKGTPPSVPCKTSFEISWDDMEDNVDLFVCKGAKCVSGGKRNVKDIGQWDSGKSKTSIWGSDLRTNQEAVRQFDKVLEGSYTLYAQFKESSKGKTTVSIKGLIYTKAGNSAEQGESFTKTLQLNKSERTLLGIVEIKADGSFIYKSK